MTVTVVVEVVVVGRRKRSGKRRARKRKRTKHTRKPRKPNIDIKTFLLYLFFALVEQAHVVPTIPIPSTSANTRIFPRRLLRAAWRHRR